MHHAQSQAAEFAGHLERAVYHSFRAGMDDPPVYHSLRRESIKTASSASPIGVQSVRPTWFQDTTPKDTAPQPNQDPQKQQLQPLHGLKLVIKRGADSWQLLPGCLSLLLQETVWVLYQVQVQSERYLELAEEARTCEA